MIDLHLSAFAPRWRFLYAVRIDAYDLSAVPSKLFAPIYELAVVDGIVQLTFRRAVLYRWIIIGFCLCSYFW